MNSEDVFFGPILRRSEPRLIIITIVTKKDFNLGFSIRLHGNSSWLSHDKSPLKIKVSNSLYFYFGQIKPTTPLPTRVLIEYGIGLLDDNGMFDYSFFDRFIKDEELAYKNYPYPTFFLQQPKSKLNAIYGSCRKIHDTNGSIEDALACGDELIDQSFEDLTKRPAILCLGGDQIYADDIDDDVFQRISELSKEIEGDQPEQIPLLNIIPKNRKDTILKAACFTSQESKNHLIKLSEYLALYGLMFNPRLWLSSKASQKFQHFVKSLKNVRRLLANIPTYMIFDDHDVTDDWNIDLNWRSKVFKSDLGRRIVSNALMSYWLCQGYGNQPINFDNKKELIKAISTRNKDKSSYKSSEILFWGIKNWEFGTPTYPLVYFLDTRTQRGDQNGNSHDGVPGSAPASLKNNKSWENTITYIQSLSIQQDPSAPLVLVSAAPIFGFKYIETIQFYASMASKISGLDQLSQFTGTREPTYLFLDLENWSSNSKHFYLFLRLFADRKVVILSGDVHYGFTSTVNHTFYDSPSVRSFIGSRTATGRLIKSIVGVSPSYEPLLNSQFIQLTSSALKNVSGGFKTMFPASMSRTEMLDTIITESGNCESGKYVNGQFMIKRLTLDNPPKIEYDFLTPKQVLPISALRQRINDSFNSEYLADHNLGVLSIDDQIVNHYFLTPIKAESPKSKKFSEHTWNFSNPKYWE